MIACPIIDIIDLDDFRYIEAASFIRGGTPETCIKVCLHLFHVYISRKYVVSTFSLLCVNLLRPASIFFVHGEGGSSVYCDFA